MNVVLPILIIAVISSVLIFALLVIVITSIHTSERRMNLCREPRTWSERITRRMLGVHSEPCKNSTRHYREPRKQLID